LEIRDYIVAKKSISIIVAIRITISQYHESGHLSGKASGSRGGWRKGRMSMTATGAGSGGKGTGSSQGL